jgi:hypothetical protein
MMFCRHRDYLSHLEAEIEWLKERLDFERKRAEMAIDQLLRHVHPDVVPLAQPTHHELMAEKVMQELTKESEFSAEAI